MAMRIQQRLDLDQQRRSKMAMRIQPARIIAIKFLIFVGRVLFASSFLLSAYQEASQFGSDGGPAARSLEPKYKLFVKKVSTITGMSVPHFQIKTVLATTLYLRALGAGLFILHSSLGAFLLLVYLLFITPVACDFYNYRRNSPQYVQLSAQYLQNLALYGALLFFWGMKRKAWMDRT